VPRQPSVRAGEFRYAGGTFNFLESESIFLELDSALRFTVALPPEHRSTLLDRNLLDLFIEAKVFQRTTPRD
jgi:hypothetical protein